MPSLPPSRLLLLLAACIGASLASSSSSSSSASGNCSSNTLSVSYPAPVAASGWSYRLVANGFTKPRGIAFDSAGALLVVDSGVGLARLTFHDEGGTCLSVANKTMLLESDELNHGLALSADSSTVYASSADKVFSWAYDARSGQLGASNRTLVANMSSPDNSTRTLLISQKQPGTLLVSRGSELDTDLTARSLASGHAQLRAFDVANASAPAYDFTDGKVLGWGLRNSVGVGENPRDGGVWSVENSVDVLYRDGKDIHQNNPAEELNFHGFLNGSSGHQGGNYGYPLCYTIWSTKGFPDLGSLTVGDQFPGTEAPKSLTDQSCNSEYVDPRLAFQAHAAPLDIKFTSDGSVAYVTFHGSWDRTNPVGYGISSVAFSTSDGQPTSAQDSTDAAVDVLTSPDLANCPDECVRPAVMAWDSQGRLWFSSDSTGEIFVMEHDGGSGSDGSEGEDSGGEGAGAQLAPSSRVAWLAAAAAVALGYLLA